MSEITFLTTRNDRTPQVSLRDVLSPLFRWRRLFMLSLCAMLLGTILAAVLLPSQYEAQIEILVKRERLDPVVTTEATTQMTQPAPAVTEEEINSEVELLKSRDLLEKVILANALQKPNKNWFWTVLLPKQDKEDVLVSRAVDQLGKKLKVEALPKTNLIEVTYRSPDPQLSYRVLNTLANLYMEKHLAVHRPPGALDFFQQETEQYQKGLAEAEARLGRFDKEQGVASAQTERDLALQKLSEFDATLHQTEAGIPETKHRISDLEAQLKVTPPRQNTTVKAADNGAVLQVLETTLSALELKHTDMVAHFQSDYRPLQDLEMEITQTRKQITQARDAPLHEDTTDVNPAYLWLTEELVKSKADLATLQARAAATSRNVQLYRQMALDFGQKQIEQEDLIRDSKVEEGNFLLYLSKREEARISDALDTKRIVNVVIAEAPTVPALPTHSGWLLVLLGMFGAFTVSTGAAFVADHFDPSLRTADEVSQVLQIPILAVVPKRNAS
jgi:uncharacterized protein involved in exopolysaccharide biosynthesis